MAGFGKWLSPFSTHDPPHVASITKSSKGYRAQVYVKGERDSATFRTKREAEAWASRRETELREQKEKPAGDRTTLREVMQRYAEEVSTEKRGHRWEALRLGLFARHGELCVDSPITQITPEHIAGWRDARIKAVTPSSVLRELTLLSSVFEHARLEWRLIQSNPVRDVRKPKMPDHREVVISRGQIKSMLKALGYRWRARPSEVRQAVAVCFLVALRSGMRAGELCGLTWDRVFDDYCTTPHKTGRTAESLRAVPLEPKARRLIEQMRGWDDATVFGLKAATLDAMFRKYRQRAGLDGFTFHDSRHTAATWLARRLDVLDLCKAMGWSSTTQALTYYNPSASDIAKRIATGRKKEPGLSR